MSASLKKQLKEKFADNIAFDIPLKQKSYLKIGGHAKYFLTLTEAEAIKDAIGYLREQGLEYFILGKGTNTLIKEGPLNPIIIQLARTTKPTIDLEKNEITYPAGILLMQAIKIALQHRLGGMEFGIGIPGSIGGAVKMNAGTYLGEVKDVLKKAFVIRHSTSPSTNHLAPASQPPNLTPLSSSSPPSVTSQNHTRITEEDAISLGLEYRSSNLKSSEIVLAAKFALSPLSEAECKLRKKTVLTTLAKRKQTQPLAANSLGSTFKNPSQNLTGRAAVPNSEKLFAARLIEAANLKGVRCGGMSVSTQHANFIINDGSATATDALRLLELIETTVYKKFGIRLEREITLLGW
ncbi:UDP-N-acetylenolpyruvoylglucosamine reductase [Spirochaetota bacterium]|nr:UDP-N-acetylenolpyruvoylglucosamine reductase [Spirochaetota bacterium]